MTARMAGTLADDGKNERSVQLAASGTLVTSRILYALCGLLQDKLTHCVESDSYNEVSLAAGAESCHSGGVCCLSRGCGEHTHTHTQHLRLASARAK